MLHSKTQELRMHDWIGSDAATDGRILVSSAGIMIGIILCIRLNGLRSLSKMSSFDFAVTVAIGSVLGATVLSDSPSMLDGTIAIAGLLLMQRVFGIGRVHLGLSRWVDNTPRILMRATEIDNRALRDTRVTQEDLFAKLREANVVRLEQVHAVILESTGDISVLHSDGNSELEQIVLSGVQGGFSDNTLKRHASD